MANAMFISKDAMRRIISDIKDLRKNPLTTHGIYYEHDDTDMLKGKALIIGPADTPYADGFYLFNIKFPANYPHSPPAVNFCTSDGVTRFNPNLYRSGKVCLSILNTWKGEAWSGCQTISSVLLAMCTILNNEPLLNEPGVCKNHRDFEPYNAIIQYKNIEVAIFGMLASVAGASVAEASTSVLGASVSEFAIFGDYMREHFQKNKEKIRLRIVDIIKNGGEQLYSINVYKMAVQTNYSELLDRFF